MNRILFFVLLFISGAASAQRLNIGTSKLPAQNKVAGPAEKFSITTSQISWDEKESYVNGFARVLKDNRFSFLDQKNHLITSVQFDDARNFVNGFAAVKKDQKWGFINEAGTTIIACKFEIVFDFTEAVTVVFAENQWKIIDKGGVIIAKPDITLCYGFKNGSAVVENNNRKGMMDLKGNILYTEKSGQSFQRPPNNISVPASAGGCPGNIDFEDGNLNNWNCFTGEADSVGNTNVITVTPSAPNITRHRVINRTTPSGIDAYGLFPTNPADGSNFAVKLGNTRIGAEAERIQYKISIPVNDSSFSIRYDYAVVLQDPGHTNWTQPRFTAKLFDSAANAYIECASFEYIATSNLPGFAVSPVDPEVIYKPWATVFVSLRNMAGKTLYLEFTTADCVRRGHWGYAYVDVESTCSHAIDVSYECTTGIATLDAPPGFQTYNWWNQDYSTLLASGQNVELNPAPQVNSTIWLEMIPFSDFGCRDSMPVQITGSFTPHFDASERAAICAPHSFTFFNRNIPAASVTWDFGDGSTGIGDTVNHTFLSAGTYIMKMTVTLPGGCTGTSVDTVSIVQPTASLTYSNGNFCGSGLVNFMVNTNNVDSIQWNFGDGTLITNTLTSISHTYAAPGIFVPGLILISNAGCRIQVPGTDSIKIEQVLPGFTFSEQRNCGSTLVNFVDTSHSFFGISNVYWDFGDGQNAVGHDVPHSYSTPGTYTVQSVVTGSTGCIDSIRKQVTIVINTRPILSITGPASACLLSTATFTAAVQSNDAMELLSWNCSNGSTGTGNNFDISFSAVGVYSIQLIGSTVNGCLDTATHQIRIETSPELNQPGDLQVCNGSTVDAVLFSSSIPGAGFLWLNDNPGIGLPASGIGNLPSFTALNNTNSTITATIIVAALSNGCEGSEKIFSITIFPSSSIAQPANQAVCNRGVTDAVIFSSFTGRVSANSYSWTNNQPGIGLPAAGTGNIQPFSAINTSGSPITANIIISESNNGCPSMPRSFTITINPTPDVEAIPNQTVCSGMILAGMPFQSNVTNATYNWTNDQPTIGLSGIGTGTGMPSFSAGNNSPAVITANVHVSAIAYGCDGTPGSFSIVVNPTPEVNQPSNQAVCTGSTTTAINFSSIVTGTNFSWTNSNPTIGLSAGGTGDILPFNPNNNGNSNLTAVIAVTPTKNGCPGITKNFVLTVYPAPSMIQPFNQFQCNGETTVATQFITSVAGTSFTWTNSLPSIGLAANGAGNIPSFTTFNAANTTVTATITVSPATLNCAGTPKTFDIVIDPSPNIAQPASQVVCIGATVAATTFSGNVNGTVFSWINSATATGLAANGNGDIPAFTATNNTNFPITSVIQVTGTANSCGSVIKVFTITVNPMPLLDAPLSQVVCNGVATMPVPLTGSGSNTGFSWTNDRPTIGLPAYGAGEIPSFIPINTGVTPVTANIILYGNNNNCGFALDTITITINPTPVIDASGNRDVCLGSPVSLAVTGSNNVVWTPATGLSCTTCTNPVATPQDSILYKVSGVNSFGCTGNDSVKLVVRRPFEMRTEPGDTMCEGESHRLNADNAWRYTWSPATGLDRADVPNPTATPSATTRYRVVGYDSYQCFSDTGYVTITVGPKPTVDIAAAAAVSNGTPITFNPVIQNGPIVRYIWSPATELSCSDCATPSAIIKNNTVYSLMVENNFGCTAVDSVFVTAFCKKAEVFVPNAFTPDGDGLNDLLMIRGTGIMVKSFRIFNRWGELIFDKKNFAANDPRYGWDGKIRGVPATPEVYVYTAEVICDNGNVYTYKGNTTILK